MTKTTENDQPLALSRNSSLPVRSPATSGEFSRIEVLPRSSAVAPVNGFSSPESAERFTRPGSGKDHSKLTLPEGRSQGIVTLSQRP